jgi:hypothetical protein
VWSAGSDRAEVFIGSGVAGVALHERSQWIDAASPRDAWERARKSIASGVQRRRFRRIPARVWLSGALARPFLVPSVAGLRHQREALEVARSLCAAATGLNGTTRIWLHDWRAGQPCLAVAVEDSVIDMIETGAKSGAVRIASIQPWWTQALNALFAGDTPPSTVAVDDGDSLIVVGAADGAVTSASAYGRMDATQARATVTRAAFLDGRQGASTALVRRPESTGNRGDGRAVPGVVFGARWEALQ